MPSAIAHRRSKHQLAALNLSDLPELLPGAQPSANPAQREEFEARCRQLSREVLAEVHRGPAPSLAISGVALAELGAMFPTVEDRALLAVCEGAASLEGAVEALLLVAATAATGSAGEATVASVPPTMTAGDVLESAAADVGAPAFDEFPILLDADGWQVCSSRAALEAAVEEPLAWSERARAVASLPQSCVRPRRDGQGLARARGPKPRVQAREGRRGVDEFGDAPAAAFSETEARYLRAECRAQQRKLRSRRLLRSGRSRHCDPQSQSPQSEDQEEGAPALLVDDLADEMAHQGFRLAPSPRAGRPVRDE
jgi:hypothetical protein